MDEDEQNTIPVDEPASGGWPGRPTVCPRCGNTNVGHSLQADWCVTDPNAAEGETSEGCGWVDAHGR